MPSQAGASNRDDGLESSVAGTVTSSNNQTSHFRLLDQPPELRLIINEFVLFSDFEERGAYSHNSLAHPLLHVSREMQAEVEETYIKALYHYWDRVNDTGVTATCKVEAACLAIAEHSEAMYQAEEAGNMTEKERRKAREVAAELDVAQNKAWKEFLRGEKKGKRRMLEVELQIVKMKLARAKEEELEDEDEDEEAEIREPSDSV